MLASTSVFEKIEIRWVSIDEMKNKRSSFRFFYREILHQLISQEAEIGKFFIECIEISVLLKFKGNISSLKVKPYLGHLYFFKTHTEATLAFLPSKPFAI